MSNSKALCKKVQYIQQFLGEQYQSSFHYIPVDNQLHLIHLILLVVLTALKMSVWLIMTKLNKTDFQYSLFV